MKTDGTDMERDGLLEVARRICIAARTAPKGKGTDNLITLVLTGTEKDEVAQEMQRVGEETGVAFFVRDAENVRSAGALVLLGTKINALGVPNCDFCGFKDCAENEKNKGICAFNTGDLGIALGSAVSVAADNRVDNRVFFSAGRAAVNLKILGPEVKIAYGIPLSVSGKSIFFDRK
ncbi:MAG: DUF2148 domain-containing protein [Spirochaetia bacterium]|jgi:uncharacterized ferredoxin-like protein|nr:hypothetical protein [Spirochaetales bacterium]